MQGRYLNPHSTRGPGSVAWDFRVGTFAFRSSGLVISKAFFCLGLAKVYLGASVLNAYFASFFLPLFDTFVYKQMKRAKLGGWGIFKDCIK